MPSMQTVSSRPATIQVPVEEVERQLRALEACLEGGTEMDVLQTAIMLFLLARFHDAWKSLVLLGWMLRLRWRVARLATELDAAIRKAETER